MGLRVYFSRWSPAVYFDIFFGGLPSAYEFGQFFAWYGSTLWKRSETIRRASIATNWVTRAGTKKNKTIKKNLALAGARKSAASFLDHLFQKGRHTTRSPGGLDGLPCACRWTDSYRKHHKYENTGGLQGRHDRDLGTSGLRLMVECFLLQKVSMLKKNSDLTTELKLERAKPIHFQITLFAHR